MRASLKAGSKPHLKRNERRQWDGFSSKKHNVLQSVGQEQVRTSLQEILTLGMEW